jgi:hypothetical protein
MSSSIGDGMVMLALAGGIVGYFYLKQQARRQRTEIIHQERMAAMEKGIPLPEFPLEAERERRQPNSDILPLMGTVFLALSLGTMIVLYRTLEAEVHGFWVSPLPLAFLGVGLLAVHALKRDAGR